MLNSDERQYSQMDFTTVSAVNGSWNNSGYDIKNNTSFRWISVDELYDPSTALIVLLSFFYGSISFLAVVGNFLVIWIVATSRRMQNVTNCFIANLALADIVIGLFTIPFQFQAALLQRWNLPHFMCPFCPFMQVLSVNVSIFTLTAIAVDRHRAILNPLSARPSKKIAKIIIGGIWLLGIILATPMMIALRVVFVDVEDYKTKKVFTKPFCSVVHLSENSMVIYRTILLFIQYIIPLCVISFVYARMAIRLWGSKAPGNAQDSRDATLIKNKKKVIKMLVIVVAIFAVCWLPLQTYQVLQTCFSSINEYRYINIIFFCCDWLAMSNSCYNPFIYGIYNEKFKREFKQRFPCCIQRTWNNSIPVDSSDMDKCHSTHTRCSSVRSTYDWRRSTRNFSTTARNYEQNIPLRCRQTTRLQNIDGTSLFDDDKHIKSKGPRISFSLTTTDRFGRTLNGNLMVKSDNGVDGVNHGTETGLNIKMPSSNIPSEENSESYASTSEVYTFPRGNDVGNSTNNNLM